MLIHPKTKEEFDSYLKDYDTVLVDFFATWCGPCRMLSPIIEEIAEENKELPVLKVDVDLLESLAKEYQIRSVPTIFVFKNGQITKRFSGFLSKQSILKMID